MKENEPQYDEALRKLLKEWRTDASLPQRFQETVWRKIERAEHPHTTALPPLWIAIGHWIGTVLSRPALAASYVTVLLGIGVTAGWAQAQRETTYMKDELGQRYVQALDPYLAPRQ